jgi:murein DD-endopeptidase MepM/ murein hydrolase activator NlpD
MPIVLTTALLLFTVAQGDALRLAYPHEAGVESVVVGWRDHAVPLTRIGNEWVGILGIDLTTEPGDYGVSATWTFPDGRRQVREETLQVIDKEFPLTRLTVAPRFVDLSEEDGARAAREAEILGALFETITPELLISGPFEVPISGGRGSNFGHSRVFNDEPRNPHSGADISAGTGTPVQATNRGRVAEVGDYFFNGNTVIIDHGQGIYSVYLHLSRIDVEVGDVVQTGDVVGLVGATGRVTGPHLHWGFRIQNARVDPFSLTRLR